MSQDKYCVIVDPYISTASICEAMRAHDIKTIAVISNSNLNEDERNKRLPKDLFDLIYFYNDETLKSLEQYHIVRVISGTDAAVHLADQLANQLTPQYANSEKTSANRNNKFLMQEALRENGINAVQQIRITNKILTQQDKANIAALTFPIFMKPVSGLCSFGARKCDDIEAVEAGVKEIMGTVDLLGERVQAITVQECLTGDEYLVDTVSLLGQHKIVSVFRYRKIYYNNKPTYRYAEIVDLQSEEASIAIDYVKQVLDALGLKNGFGHTEIFLTPKGPYLIELNPRISGIYGYVNKLANLSYGLSQATLMAESIIDPDQFLKHYNQLPKLGLFGLIVLLQVWSERRLNSFNVEQAKTLASYREHLMLFPEGEKCHPPESLTDTVGFVLLANKDKEALKQDYDKIEQWERENVLF